MPDQMISKSVIVIFEKVKKILVPANTSAPEFVIPEDDIPIGGMTAMDCMEAWRSNGDDGHCSWVDGRVTIDYDFLSLTMGKEFIQLGLHFMSSFTTPTDHTIPSVYVHMDFMKGELKVDNSPVKIDEAINIFIFVWLWVTRTQWSKCELDARAQHSIYEEAIKVFFENAKRFIVSQP